MKEMNEKQKENLRRSAIRHWQKELVSLRCNRAYFGLPTYKLFRAKFLYLTNANRQCR